MFGIEKCFGGPRWGVIAVIDDYALAAEVAVRLQESGGAYRVVPMSKLWKPRDRDWETFHSR